MSQENVEIVRAIFQAWKERDPEAALKRLDPSIEFNRDEAITGRGRDALQRAIAGWFTTFESMEFFPEGFIDAGDHVIVWVRVVAKGRGSGVPVEGRIAAVYTIGTGW